MSRSYKKHPILNDSSAKNTKESKKFANKKIRNATEEIKSGKSYKKYSESYDIRDFSIRYTWAEAKRSYEDLGSLSYEFLHRKYPTLKEFYRSWRKNYKNK